MDVNSLPKTVTRQRHDCNLNPGLSAAESSTLATRLPSHPMLTLQWHFTQVVPSYSCDAFVIFDDKIRKYS